MVFKMSQGYKMTMKSELTEAEFRQRVQETFNRVERAFSDVDPDLAECEQSLGSLTITFSDRTRCILSTQPSVRQLWLALAAQGTAHHFDWIEQAGSAAWRDDKGKGIELLTYLQGVLTSATGTAFQLL